jgi:hypothetical protein
MSTAASRRPLYRRHELNIRTQYAELKERAMHTARLLPGSPGVLAQRAGSGRAYWYRVFQEASGKQAEDYICRADERDRRQAVLDEIEESKWVQTQVRNLRKLSFQVADKSVARVLVELYNAQLLRAGLCVVGTLGYMAWLNELGVLVSTAQTQDLDFGTPLDLKLAASRSFLEIMQDTRLGFTAVPGLAPAEGSSSVKRPGPGGLRVDVLTTGQETGRSIELPTLQWSAQTVEHFDYLLGDVRDAAVMAGTHCIPVRIPAVDRFVWHKLFSSIVRRSFPEKALKDRTQALLLAAVLCEDDADQLLDSADTLPKRLRDVLVEKKEVLLTAARDHEPTVSVLQRVLGRS